MSALPDVLTPEEYLLLERQRSYKSEYLAGQVYALAGGSRQHNLIVANVVAALHRHLHPRMCSVFPSDLRIHVPSGKYYTYPDVSAACDFILPGIFSDRARQPAHRALHAITGQLGIREHG